MFRSSLKLRWVLWFIVFSWIGGQPPMRVLFILYTRSIKGCQPDGIAFLDTDRHAARTWIPSYVAWCHPSALKVSGVFRVISRSEKLSVVIFNYRYLLLGGKIYPARLEFAPESEADVNYWAQPPTGETSSFIFFLSLSILAVIFSGFQPSSLSYTLLLALHCLEAMQKPN